MHKESNKGIMFVVFFAIFSVGFALSSCTGSQARPDAQSPFSVKDEDRQCKADDDCMSYPSDCCGCASGGNQTAINKSALESLAKARANSCAGVVCAQVYRCVEGSVAKCVSGLCELVER